MGKTEALILRLCAKRIIYINMHINRPYLLWNAFNIGIQHRQNAMTSLLSEPHAISNDSIKKANELTPTPT